MTNLPLLWNWKGNSYHVILLVINYLTKIVYYEPLIIIIDVTSLVEVINMMVKHHDLQKSIIIDQSF